MEKLQFIKNMIPILLNHFKKHWWKWVIFAAVVGFSFSGYKFSGKEKTFEKTKPFSKSEKINDKSVSSQTE